jgi:hypothetical protein
MMVFTPTGWVCKKCECENNVGSLDKLQDHLLQCHSIKVPSHQSPSKPGTVEDDPLSVATKRKRGGRREEEDGSGVKKVGQQEKQVQKSLHSNKKNRRAMLSPKRKSARIIEERGEKGKAKQMTSVDKSKTIGASSSEKKSKDREASQTRTSARIESRRSRNLLPVTIAGRPKHTVEV